MPQRRSNHDHTLKMIKMQGGVFGAVASSAALIGALVIIGETPLPSGALSVDAIAMTIASATSHARQCRTEGVRLFPRLLLGISRYSGTLVKYVIGCYHPTRRRHPGRRPAGRDRRSKGRACARARHRTPSVSHSCRHDGSRSLVLARDNMPARCRSVGPRTALAGVSCRGCHSRCRWTPRSPTFRRRAPKVRDPEAALSEAASSSSRSANTWCNAERGRQDVRHVRRHGRGRRSSPS